MSNITVPYSVNAINGHSSSYSKGNYTFTTTINLPKAQPTYLWFQHADQSADIYVDNVKVTTHWGGYNAFFTDISEYVHAGENEIKVILCNTTRNTLAPCSADFNFNATLGKVKVITSPVMPDMFYGYDGFHITATNVSSAAATLTIKTSVPVGATVVCKIDDDDSNYHFYDEKPSTGEDMSFITTITNPTLWNGKINPHLYDVTLEIYKNGDLYHRFQRGYGIRYYSYVYNYTLPNNETYTGFLLNGSPYLLRGVCMHDDLEGKANALDDDDYTQEFAMINEVGCNFIRLAHYPHPKEVYDWCDRLGIIVQTEVPLVNNIKSTQPEDYYTHLEDQYYDMVTQHYNHPCIMFWGLGNEFNAQMDSDGGAFACTKLEHFRDIIKEYDTERMVGCVLNANSSNPRSTVGGADMDWYGCNIYVGWYSNTNSNNPTSQLNTRLNNVKDRPIAYSEYGCGGTQHCHSENYMSTTTRGNHERHDIEYQMWLHEGHIAAIKNFPQLLFTSEWQFFDIAVSNRNEGYTVCLDGENSYIDDNLRRLNNKGLVERDHITKKDTFYLYKAWWNQTDKFVHICGKDYEKYENRVIKCYTNDGDSLTLYVNDTEIETVNVTNNIATFTARSFDPGDVIIVEGDNSNDTLNVIDYNAEYFTFDILSDGDIIWKNNHEYMVGSTISYSKNGGNWTDITSTTSGVSIPVNKGDKVRFKGSNNAYGVTFTKYNSFNGTTATFNVYGNIMSLIGGDNFSNLKTLSSDYTFCGLFRGCGLLKSAKNLILPATTLVSDCYSQMFYGCTSLISTPTLPATTLASNCYDYMFENCTSLTTAPSLPANTLADGCYKHMFTGCTSLTTAPSLPATTMETECYLAMFARCTSLTTAPSLPAITLANECYGSMFINCTSLTTAPELPVTTLTSGCYQYMFENCTSLTTAPELPATTLASNCYYEMFYGCTSLNYIKCLATDISATDCTTNWVNGVSATGTFMKDDDIESWTIGTDGIPTGWTICNYSEYEYLTKYLTFDVKSNGNITWTASDSNNTKTISYSKNDGEWTSITSSTSGVSIPVTTGDKVRFKGSNSAYGTSTNYNSFGGTSTFDVSGNIMSLVGGDDFSSLNTISTYVFSGLFENCTGLLSAKDIILPAVTVSYCYNNMFEKCINLTEVPSLKSTTLAENCYSGMFRDCSSLTTTPELPATTLSVGCYEEMFRGCTNLTTVSTLPALTLTQRCYKGMFYNCSSLTTAPDLCSQTLANYCYQNMFTGCVKLNYIKCLAGSISATGCTTDWVKDVAPTGTFVRDYNYSWSGIVTYSGIPVGWTSEIDYTNEYLTFNIKTSGTLYWKKIGYDLQTKSISYKRNNGSWTTLTSSTSGTSITVNAGDIIRFRGSNTSYGQNVSSEIQYTCFSDTGSSASYDVYGNVMSLIKGDNFKTNNKFNTGTSYNLCGLFINCTKLISAENLVLPSHELRDYSYCYMFKGCTGLTTAPKCLPATILARNSCASMFYGCTNLTSVPKLPATKLDYGCYGYMFKGCTSLTTAPDLPASKLTGSCYLEMFSGCTNLNYIKCLATDISATDCTDNWVYNVAGTGTFVKDLNMTNWTTGNNGIPTGWTTDTNQYVSLSTNEVCTCLDGSTITLNVSSNIPWTATNSNNWVTLSQSSGQSGNTTISLTINSSEIGRTGAITFNGTETLTINQYNYLTFDVLSDGYIYWKTDNNSSSTYKSSIQYNKNGIWRTLNYNDSLYANSGDVILFRGNKSSGQYGKYLSNNVYYNKFDTNVRFNVKGDIHSLFSYTFYDDTVTYSGGNFPNLFKGCTNLISAEDLILSGALSGSDTYGAYSSMFYGCTSLTKAPKVINNDISDCYGRAYIYMFYGCTSLTSAPALPATTLSSQCYYYMFRGCTSLTTAPVLPATTLISGCYNGMFSGCTSLNYIKCLATDISATNCTNNWVNNVAATGTFIKDSSMTSWSTGTYGIPSGWTVVDNT